MAEEYPNPLTALRHQRNLSRTELAHRTGVSPSAQIRIERGQVVPSREAVAKLLRALDASEAEVEEVWDYLRKVVHEDAILRARQEEVDRIMGVATPSSAERRVDRAKPLRPVSQSGRPDPTPITTPVELAEALNAVLIWAGSPSLRRLQEASNGILRRATVSDMLNTKKVEGTQKIPDLDRYVAFVRVCGIRDVEEWVSAWRRLKARQRPQAGGWLKV